MKKLLVITAVTVMVLSSLCGHSLLNALADETEQPAMQRYFTSIEIQEGDSLWKIATEYAPGCGMTTMEYIDELKSMNGIKDDVIHHGQHLTVMYSVPVTGEALVSSENITP